MAQHRPNLSIRRSLWDSWAVTEVEGEDALPTGEIRPATKHELLGRHLRVIDETWPDAVFGENTVLVSLGLVEWRLPRWAGSLPPGEEGVDWRVVSAGYVNERMGVGPRGRRAVADIDRIELRMSALGRTVYRYRDERKNLALDAAETRLGERRRPQDEAEGRTVAEEARARHLAAVEAAGEDGTAEIERIPKLRMRDVQLDGTDVWDDEPPRPLVRWAGELD